MNRTHKIAQNTFFLIAAQIFNIAGRLLFSIFLVRYLGAINLGHISIAIAIIELFHIITDFGLGIVATREIAQDKARVSQYFGVMLGLKFMLALVASLLVFAIVRIAPYSSQVRIAVYIMIPSIFFNSLFTSFICIFRAHENMQHESLISLSSSFIYILLGFFAIYLKLGIFFIAALTTMSALVNLCMAAIIYRVKYQAVKLIFDKEFAQKLFKTSLPIGVGIILAMALSRLDVILLSLLKGANEVGLYSAAYRLIATFLFVPYYLATSMFPVMSDWQKQEKTEELKVLVEKIIRFSMIFIIPVAVFFSLVSGKLIVILYGNSFSASGPILALLLWYLVAAFPAFILTHLLFLSHAKEYALFYLIALLVNVVSNLLLIPVLGMTAVAINAIISVLIIDFLSYHRIYTRLIKLNIVKPIILPLVASLGIVILVFSFKTLNILYLLFYSITLYFLILYLIRGLTRQDIIFFKGIIRLK